MNAARKGEVSGLFTEMGTRLGELTEEKNEAYGDSFAKCGEILGILYPNGIAPEQYRDALGVTRVIDKLFRIANRKNAFGESPWRDIAGYGIVAAVADEGVLFPVDSPVPFFPAVPALSVPPPSSRISVDPYADPVAVTLPPDALVDEVPDTLPEGPSWESCKYKVVYEFDNCHTRVEYADDAPEALDKVGAIEEFFTGTVKVFTPAGLLMFYKKVGDK